MKIGIGVNMVGRKDMVSPGASGISWNSTDDVYDASPGFQIGACTIHKAMRRCVLSDAGVVQYYLDPNDSTKKADGTSANLDGTDGQVMVQIPKFYFKYEYSSPTHTYKISDRPQTGFNLHPAFVKAGVEVDYRYMGAYEGIWYDASADGGAGAYADPDNSNDLSLSISTANDKIGSISGQYPIVGVTRGECRLMSANRGTGWHQQDWYLTHAVQLLFVTEYGDFNSQEVVSDGNTRYSSWPTGSGNTRTNPSGLSNSLGNGSGGVSTAGGSVNDFVTYRGIENFWGSVWQWVDGVNVNVNSDLDSWWTTNDYRDFADDTASGYTKITDSMPSNGFVKDFKDIADGFIPSVTGGTSSTFVGDNFFGSTALDRVVLFGGSAVNGASAGAFCWIVDRVSSARVRSFGCRLSF